MATLTEVSYLTRRMIKWGAVVFFILLISPAVLAGIKKIYLTIHPPAPAAPTVKYGKLPALDFPSPNGSQPKFTLQTIDGKLPALPKVGKVYIVQINESRLLALDRFKPKAAILGFTNNPTETVAGQTYEFTHPTLPAKLVINIISSQLSYRQDWTLDQSLYSAINVPSNDQALIEAKAFLTNLNLLSPDLASGNPQYLYYKATPPTLTPVSSLSEANFVRVNIYRADLDKLPFVATGGNKAPVSVLFSGSVDRAKRVVEFDYQYSQILDNNFATYPLKPVDEAWTQLRQGKGYIATPAGDNIIVRKVYLAYYESNSPQQFLQPVFVFSGDNNFLGYVPAVTADYQEQK